MRSGLFKRLRERQVQREIEKVRREGFDAGRRHAEIIGRVEWAAAAGMFAMVIGERAPGMRVRVPRLP